MPICRDANAGPLRVAEPAGYASRMLPAIDHRRHHSAIGEKIRDNVGHWLDQSAAAPVPPAHVPVRSLLGASQAYRELIAAARRTTAALHVPHEWLVISSERTVLIPHWVPSSRTNTDRRPAEFCSSEFTTLLEPELPLQDGTPQRMGPHRVGSRRRIGVRLGPERKLEQFAESYVLGLRLKVEAYATRSDRTAVLADHLLDEVVSRWVLMAREGAARLSDRERSETAFRCIRLRLNSAHPARVYQVQHQPLVHQVVSPAEPPGQLVVADPRCSRGPNLLGRSSFTGPGEPLVA